MSTYRISSKHRISAVFTLLFVSPLVAEYLLGDLPIKLLPVLIVLVPFYGGAAVLIREIARRTRRGWPTILMMSAAYALLEEGLVTQSLFNHDYLKMHMHLLDHAYLPSLGVGAWWSLLMVNLHTFWSMGVSIALAEALFPAEAETPWLGQLGCAVMAVVFVLGAAANCGIGSKQNNFVASTPQLLSVAMLSVLLILSAFLISSRWSRNGRKVPAPYISGAITLVLGLGVLFTPPTWGWFAVSAMLAIDAVFLILVAHSSRQTGWSALHVLSLAAGGALAYGIHAFTQKPLVGGMIGMRISNTVFFVASVGLICVAARRVLRYQTIL